MSILRIILIVFVIVIAGCMKTNQVKNFQTSGNLEAPDPEKCVDINDLKPSQNPADIFIGISECLKNHHYEKAANMYFAAMTYGVYDTKRVSDKTAHQAIPVLRMNSLHWLNPDQVKLMDSEIKKVHSNKQLLCQKLKARGKPSYYPMYMIQHGMGAFAGSQSNKGLVSDFNPDNAWDETLKSSIKCN